MFRYRSRWILGLILAVTGAGVACAKGPQLVDGVLTLRAGDYTATFTEEAFWTLDTLDYKEVALITPTGANQSVIKLQPRSGLAEKDEWVGTKHGHEVVESMTLEIDGKTFKLPTTEALPEGKSYRLEKVARFGPLRGTWTVELDADGLKEKASFEKAEPDISQIAYAYVFMHCWSPRMQDWMAVLKDGSEVGERFPDTASKSLQDDVSAVAVYSADEQTGAVLAYPKAYQGFVGRQSFLNNFPGRHNKLYLTLSREALVREPYSCFVQGFSAAPDQWKQVVAEKIAHAESVK